MNRYIPVGILRFSLGLFLLVLGITNTVPVWDTSIFSFTGFYHDIEWIFGIVEIFLGVLMLSGFASAIRRNTRTWAHLVVLIFWAVRFLFVRFVQMLYIDNSAIVFRPNFSGWILLLSVELIIGAAIFVMYQSE